MPGRDSDHSGNSSANTTTGSDQASQSGQRTIRSLAELSSRLGELISASEAQQRLLAARSELLTELASQYSEELFGGLREAASQLREMMGENARKLSALRDFTNRRMVSDPRPFDPSLGFDEILVHNLRTMEKELANTEETAASLYTGLQELQAVDARIRFRTKYPNIAAAPMDTLFEYAKTLNDWAPSLSKKRHLRPRNQNLVNALRNAQKEQPGQGLDHVTVVRCAESLEQELGIWDHSSSISG